MFGIITGWIREVAPIKIKHKFIQSSEGSDSLSAVRKSSELLAHLKNNKIQ